MVTQDQKDKVIYNMHDVVETISDITCGKCKKTDSTQGDNYDAVEEFYNDGWRVTHAGKVYCRKCAKKYLKAKKYQ